MAKSPEKPEENTSNEKKPKIAQKKKRKTKFNQFLNEESLSMRYITVILIREH